MATLPEAYDLFIPSSPLSTLEDLEPAADDAMKAFVSKKHALQTVPILLGTAATIAYGDLKRLDTATTKMYDALLLAIWPALFDETTKLKNHVHVVIEAGAAAFANPL
ncbi:hypothetical protein ONZ45_g17030 [Pleurotus djamor]|nr:hypothetical protein ONZ45_g17030 [Pleurotus djamor]